MRIALYSDPHLEMVLHQKAQPASEPPELDEDAVILAGDIGAIGIEWAGGIDRSPEYRQPFHFGRVDIYSSPINSRPTFMFSTTAASICSRHEPTLPVWFGSRLFVHSERITTRISR